MADEGSRGGTRVVVIVAIVGLLSTLGASLVAGALTIVATGVEFQNQRDAANEDKRREVYVNYQNSATKVCQVVGGGYAFGDPSAEEAKAAAVKIDAALAEMINLNGQVQLFAHTDEMRKASDELSKQMVKDIDPICNPHRPFSNHNVG